MMQRHRFLGWLWIAFTSLTGCHSLSGNVVPQGGPAMEAVYDSMSKHHTPSDTVGIHSFASTHSVESHTQLEAELEDIRHTPSITRVSKPSSWCASVSSSAFHALPNPELTLYVYPHFAGREAVPIPGYDTVFHAYEKTYYALPTEVIR